MTWISVVNCFQSCPLKSFHDVAATVNVAEDEHVLVPIGSSSKAMTYPTKLTQLQKVEHLKC